MADYATDGLVGVGHFLGDGNQPGVPGIPSPAPVCGNVTRTAAWGSSVGIGFSASLAKSIPLAPVVTPAVPELETASVAAIAPLFLAAR